MNLYKAKVGGYIFFVLANDKLHLREKITDMMLTTYGRMPGKIRSHRVYYDVLIH